MEWSRHVPLRDMFQFTLSSVELERMLQDGEHANFVVPSTTGYLFTNQLLIWYTVKRYGKFISVEEHVNLNTQDRKLLELWYLDDQNTNALRLQVSTVYILLYAGDEMLKVSMKILKTRGANFQSFDKTTGSEGDIL